MAVELTYVKGLPELAAHLKTLPAKIRRTCLRNGVAAGARLVRDQAKRNAPISSGMRLRKGTARIGGKRVQGQYKVPPGTLRRAALLKFVKEESNDTQVNYIVTFRKGRNQQARGRDAFYASWVEFGHKIVARFKGKYTDYKIRGRGRLTGISLRRRQATASGRRTKGARFLTSAIDQLQATARDRMIRTIRTDLLKISDFKP